MAKISNELLKVNLSPDVLSLDCFFLLLAYGTETIRDLVPKVIRILELLELQAAKNEKQIDEFLEMRMRIERLEAEKSETRELREKYERDVELIEDQWRKEVRENDGNLPISNFRLFSLSLSFRQKI